MLASLLEMADLEWAVLDYTTLCRPQKTLAVRIAYRRADGPLNLLVDNIGIKFLSDCEWQVRKQGVQGRRQWRKVHLAMDTAPSDIRAVEFTSSSDGASPVLPECSVRCLKAKTSTRSPPKAPMIRAATTLPSSTARPLQSSRSARTTDRGKKTARPQSLATKRCVQPSTLEGRSGSAGPDIMHKA
jgi:hypothetical protein